jgi:DNA invertase Pin-like site-specific DNA recombinase
MSSLNGKHPLEVTAGSVHRRRTLKKRADRPKVSIREALTVLRKMEKGGGSIHSLVRAAGVSRATVYRILADCKDELGIRFKRDNGAYSVTDWGLLSRRRVLR